MSFIAMHLSRKYLQSCFEIYPVMSTKQKCFFINVIPVEIGRILLMNWSEWQFVFEQHQRAQNNQRTNISPYCHLLFVSLELF